MDAEHPKLRPLEAIRAQDNMICLRDPAGISDKLVFLPLNLYFIVSLFDGERSILDIQAAYTRQFGDILFSDKIRQIIEQLDGCLFLESDRFREARRKAVEEFRNAPFRPATHAGTAYPKEPGELRAQLKALFDGLGDGGRGEFAAGKGNGKRLAGLIAPHIDVRRGGACFASSYAELARGGRAETYVVFGISHVPTARRFVLTDKDFETPLGTIPADRGFIERLAGRLSGRGGFDFFEDELVHLYEHSIEFQALFLRYLFTPETGIRIVPILCSSRDEPLRGGSPRDDPEFSEFLAALKTELAAMGDRACCIAGVDLSHLGRRFGQDFTMTPDFLKTAEAEDMAMIERILERDAEGFFRLILEEKDRRNVCGVPAIYALLRILDAGKSRLIRYDQAVDPSTQSVVTFMGAAFYD
jgi:AmmeMemoRadiSam system protein B